MAKITSDQWSLIEQDLQKILTGASMAAVGAFLTYVINMIAKIDFGPWTPVITALMSILANVVRKWAIVTTY